MEFLYEIDKSIFLFFNARLVHSILDVLMPLITNFGTWAVPAVLVSALFVYRRRKEALIVLGLVLVTVALSDPISSQILKKIFARPRPCHPEFFVEGGRFLLGMRSSLSFPSSHSMNMFSIAMLLTCFYPRRWMYFFTFAALIGYTRIYCGVHYPSDVLGGAIFGCLLGWGIYKAYVKIACKYSYPKRFFQYPK